MSPKTFQALGHLQDYADASEQAHEELKSCIWQLTKSRRNVRSGIIGVDSTTAYTAELLREELRAQIRVVNDDGESNDSGDIDLVDEDSAQPPASNAKDDGPSKTTAPQWKAINVVSELETARKNASPDGDENDRPISLDTSPSSSWTMVQEDDLNSDAEEEEKIIRTDPIKLFGGYFTARELKVAQRNAQQSLEGYIRAANQAAKLLELLRENKE